MAWLVWVNTDQLQALAGGRTTSFRAWSKLFLRCEWLGVAIVMLGFGIEVGDWLLDRWFPVAGNGD